MMARKLWVEWESAKLKPLGSSQVEGSMPARVVKKIQVLNFFVAIVRKSYDW